MKSLKLFLIITLLHLLEFSVTSQQIVQMYKRQMYSLAIDKDTIWVGGKGSIFKTDLKGNLLKQYTDSILPKGPYKAIAIDKQGNKWIGTSHGVIKFTGSNFQVFDSINHIALDSITCITIDSSGKKWIGTRNNGIWIYNDTTWINYNTSNSTIGSNAVNVIAFQNKDTAWIGKNNGLIRYVSGNWHLISQYVDININCIAYDQDKLIWVSANNSILSAFNYKTEGSVFSSSPIYCTALHFHDTYIYGSDLNSGIFYIYPKNFISVVVNGSQKNIIDFIFDKHDSIWFINDNLGKKLPASNNKIYILHDQQICSNSITYTAFDNNGKQWFGSSDNGICSFDGKTWTNYNSLNGLKYNYISQIKISNNNNIWVSTFEPTTAGYGLSVIDSGKCANINLNPYLITYYQINCIETDNQNNLWVGSNVNGVLKYNGKIWTQYGSSNGFVDNPVQTIARDKNGTLWFGLSGQLFSYNGNWTKITNSYLSNRAISFIALDSANNKWIETDSTYSFTQHLSKIYKYNDTTLTFISQNKIIGTCNSVSIDKNSYLWCSNSYYDSRLWKFDKKDWLPFSINNFTINYVLVDKNNNKWICTSGGLFLFKDNCTSISQYYPVLSGPTSVCVYTQNFFGVNNNSLNELFNVYSFKWHFPNNSDTILANVSYNNFTVPGNTKSGYIKVQYINLCGLGSADSAYITVKQFPSKLSAITGDTKVCAGANISYAVNSDSLSNNYSWHFSNNISGSSTSNIININFSDTITTASANINVRGQNSCGSGPVSNLSLKVLKKIPNIDSIVGINLICTNKENILYSVSNDTINETKYLWNLPNGVSGTNGSNFISLNFDTSFKTGAIRVKAYNSCGDTSVQMNIKSSVMFKPVIKVKWGDLLFCSNSQNIYTNYQWYFNNSSINNANNQYYSVNQTGKYNVIVNNVDKCIDSSNIYNFTKPNGISSIFPNPFNKQITAKIASDETGAVLFNLYNSQGLLVKQFSNLKSGTEIQLTINVEDLFEGLYNSSILINNHQIHSEQIVKIK